MHQAIIFKVLGLLLMVFSITMLPPIVVSFYYSDGAHYAFLSAFLITLITGAVLWVPFSKHKRDLQTRDGFLITVLFWTVLGLFGSLPFILAEYPALSFIDAIFESLSGLTTTGATVIVGLDLLPKSILYYRQQLQWFGGIGIIVIAVAILPILGIGGMQLYRAETPGPIKDSKLTPRITETAKALFLIYLGLTIACAASYYWAGMDLFDAIGHSFSTVAIGGFSTHDASIAYFESPIIMAMCSFFMIVSGVNFALHFFAWRKKTVLHYFFDPEFKFYIYSLLFGITLAVSYLFLHGTYNFSNAFIHGMFQVISIATTTGYATADFANWPTFLPWMLFLMSFIGGCAGSTGGGLKVIRVLLIFKQGYRELRRLIHPNAIIPLKLGRKPVDDRVIEAVWGFLAVYALAYIIMLLGLLATGIDFLTAFSAVGACINNLGPGLGEVAQNYGDINVAAKWILCFAMLLGRLEVFTLLVLFTPMFWRR